MSNSNRSTKQLVTRSVAPWILCMVLLMLNGPAMAEESKDPPLILFYAYPPPWMFDKDEGFTYSEEWISGSIKDGAYDGGGYSTPGNKYGNMGEVIGDYDSAEIKILLFGSSYTASEMTNMVQERLAKQLGKSVCVLNFWRDSTGILTMFDSARANAEKYKPDRVLFALSSTCIPYHRRYRPIIPAREHFWSFYQTTDPTVTTDPRHALLHNLIMISDLVTKEWCEKMEKAREAGDEKTLREDPIVKQLIEQYYWTERKIEKEKKEFGTAVLDKPFFDYGEDQRFLEDLKYLQSAGVPFDLIHIPHLEEYNSEGTFEFAAASMDPVQCEKLAVSLEKSTEQKIVRLAEYVNPELRATPLKLVTAEKNWHPGNEGPSALADAMVKYLAPMFEKTEGTAKRPCPIEADIWVLGGQSNMMPFGHLEEPVNLDPSRVLCFRSTNEWATADEPLGVYHESVDPVHRLIHIQGGGSAEDFDRIAREGVKRTPGGVGVGTGFAKRIIDNMDINIGLIPCAHGGTYMFQWDPALKSEGGASLYGSMMNRIALTGGKIKGILWYQGENECSDHYADKYEEALLNLIDTFRRDMGDSDLPFIYVQLGCFYSVPPENYRAWEKVREIQRRVALMRKNVYVVSAIDLAIGDGMHLSGESAQRLGWRLGEVALSEVYDKAGHGRSINLESIKVYDLETHSPFIKLHFSGVTGRLKAYGRPADFSLRVAQPHTYSPQIFRTDFDPDDPAGLILRIRGKIEEPVQLIYGIGPTPYCNIVDERDIHIPAIGPIDLPMENEK